jgi:hypothetical protein
VNDLLSQEEIDALLNAGGSDSAEDSGSDAAEQAAPPPEPSPEPAAAAGGSSGSSGSSTPPETLSQEAIEKLSEVAKLSLGATSSVVQSSHQKVAAKNSFWPKLPMSKALTAIHI